MTYTIHIAIISYAHLHAPRYAASIAAHPRARLAAIAGTGVNADVARAEAERYGVPYCDDYEELLSLGNVDAVYVATGPAHHRRVVTWAAAHGIHVLCDKPIAMTLEEADAIVELARAAGIKLMVPFNPRFQLPLIKVKEALDSGEAGELVAIYAVQYGRLPTRAPGPQRADWFLDPAQTGGGGFLDKGIHGIDALRWLAGAEAKRVHAHIGTMIYPDLATDDLGTVTVEFDNGVVAVLTTGWANPDGYPAWPDERFEILTTKRAFLINSPYHGFTIHSQQRTERRYWWRRDVDGLVDEFVQAILQDRDPAITGEDGRAALAIALAAYESARRGRVILMK
jgi:predicted dehydrogenase